jgi:hypothetical protein
MPTIPEHTADAMDFFPVGTLYKKIRFMLSFEPENCPGEEADFVLSVGGIPGEEDTRQENKFPNSHILMSLGY